MKQVSVKEFEKALTQSNVATEFVNVCTEVEFRMMYIDGVKNIPLQELVARVDELRDAKTIYLFCFSGARSAYAAELLASLDIEAEVLSVIGGYSAWVREGCEV